MLEELLSTEELEIDPMQARWTLGGYPRGGNHLSSGGGLMINLVGPLMSTERANKTVCFMAIELSKMGCQDHNAKAIATPATTAIKACETATAP